MKYLIIAVLAITLFSCTKEARNPETIASLKTKYGIDLIGEWEKKFGGTARPSKPKPKAEQVVTIAEDLVLSGSVTCTVSPDAEWGGIQKFLAIPLNVDGAVSYCNFYWWSTATPMNCPTTQAGVYRGWTSDHNYDVHLSNVIQIP